MTSGASLGRSLWSHAFPWGSQRTHLVGEEPAGIRLRASGTVRIWARGWEGKRVGAAGLLPTRLFPSSPQQKAWHSTTQANQRKVEWRQGWSSSALCLPPVLATHCSHPDTLCSFIGAWSNKPAFQGAAQGAGTRMGMFVGGMWGGVHRGHEDEGVHRGQAGEGM